MTTTDVRTTAVLARELEPVAARELDRHVTTAKEWFPHQYVPWSEGTDYDGEYDGLPWAESQSRIDKVGRIALVINLLTEDNLPSYHRAIIATTGNDDAWGEWVGRWTAEEARHAVAMRDYLTVTRAIDPVALERERMVHMTRGFESDVEQGMLTGMAYVSFQELATRISHRNTGRYTNDPGCDRLLARIAADENLHMLFYRNVMSAAFEIAPDDAMQAVVAVAEGFQMPGAEVEGFVRRSVQIAMAGIYDLRIHHDEVLSPVLRAWNVFERTDLGPTGEAARDRLALFLQGLDAAATRFEDKRAARLDRIAQHA
jgi:acyl-[acyl-carrier-protein] desaturase